MDSKPGQMFLNYAYSWGASIVILGALFKLTHIAGADIMLFLGMGTEVIVFFLAGFERPYDVDTTPEQQESARQQIADAAQTENAGQTAGGGTVIVGGAGQPAAGGTVIVGGGAPAGGTIIIGGGSGVVGGTPVQEGDATGAEQLDAAQLAGAIAASPIMSSAQFNGMCPEMQEATQAYVEQLTELTDILKKVAEQSARLTRDSEEMETMNRRLTGINRFYEMQLRSVSAQSSTIDDVHDQTKRLAAQLEELNSVYARMVEALKVNMGPASTQA